VLTYHPSQANYSAAGTYQDALSVHRRKNGLNSTTIDLGIVSDVGYIAENPEQFERLRYLKPLFISERDLRLLLTAAMLGNTRDGLPVPPQVVTGVGSELIQDGSIGSAMNADLKYSNLHGTSGDDSANAGEDEQTQEALKACTSLSAATDVVEAVFAFNIAKATGMEPEDVDMEKPMHAYGVDSLAAVEVRNMIFRKFRSEVSVFDLLSTMALRRLAVKVVANSKITKNEVQMAAQEKATESED
jgi:acyl carrier protein